LYEILGGDGQLEVPKGVGTSPVCEKAEDVLWLIRTVPAMMRDIVESEDQPIQFRLKQPPNRLFVLYKPAGPVDDAQVRQRGEGRKCQRSLRKRKSSEERGW